MFANNKASFLLKMYLTMTDPWSLVAGSTFWLAFLPWLHPFTLFWREFKPQSISFESFDSVYLLLHRIIPSTRLSIILYQAYAEQSWLSIHCCYVHFIVRNRDIHYVCCWYPFLVLLTLPRSRFHLWSSSSRRAWTDQSQPVRMFVWPPSQSRNSSYFVCIAITSTGFGDFYPVTTSGRLIVMFIVLGSWIYMPVKVCDPSTP